MTAIYYYYTRDTERVVLYLCINLEEKEDKCTKLHSNIAKEANEKGNFWKQK